MLTRRTDSLSILKNDAEGLLFEGTTRVVLVHGAMDRARSFTRLIRHLTAAGFDCVSYDRRGYEDSALQDPFSIESPPGIEDHIDDLAEVIGSEPSIVFGHSVGGTIALCLAEQNRAPIKALVTFESPLPWMSFWQRSGAYAIVPGTEIAQEFAEEFATKFMVRMIGEHRWDRLPPSTKRRRRAEGAVLVAEMSTIGHRLPALDPSRIRVPCLVARGENAAPRHIQAVDYLVGHIPHAIEIVVAGTDHGIHLSNPKRAAELVEIAHRQFTC